MITIDGLTKQYGTTLAVDDVSLTAEAGRVTGFLGPNGAGPDLSTTQIGPVSAALTIAEAELRNERHDENATRAPNPRT